MLAPLMQLGRIIIFPIKSLDGFLVESARFTGGGILENDRVFAIYDTAGKVVNGIVGGDYRDVVEVEAAAEVIRPRIKPPHNHEDHPE